MPETDRKTLDVVRLALLAILLVGLIGTMVELYLLRHTEGAWEMLPLVLMGISLVLFAWYAVSRSALVIRTIRLVMVGFVVTGAIGVWLHFRVNEQYALESFPGISRWELYREAAYGATPMLAPGTMLQLGLVGLLFTFRHPSLGGFRLTQREER